MTTLGLKNAVNERRVTGCALCVNPHTKGALRACLCDLKPMTPPNITWRGLQKDAPRLARHPSLLTGAPCSHTSGADFDGVRVFIIQVLTSNTKYFSKYFWLHGLNVQSQAPFRATTWDLLLMTCYWCQRSASMRWSKELATNHI